MHILANRVKNKKKNTESRIFERVATYRKLLYYDFRRIYILRERAKCRMYRTHSYSSQKLYIYEPLRFNGNTLYVFFFFLSTVCESVYNTREWGFIRLNIYLFINFFYLDGWRKFKYFIYNYRFWNIEQWREY